MKTRLMLITADDVQSAQRGLRMVAMSLDELRALIEEHELSELFAGRVVTIAARQMLAAKLRMGAREDE